MYKIKRFGAVKSANKIAKKAWEMANVKELSKKVPPMKNDIITGGMPHLNEGMISGRNSLSRFRKMNRNEIYRTVEPDMVNPSINLKGKIESKLSNKISGTGSEKLRTEVMKSQIKKASKDNKVSVLNIGKSRI